MDEIAYGCASAGKPGDGCLKVPDRGRAIEIACELARPGDIVMVCGKGHEQSMCFGTTEYPWDDRVALAAVLEGREPPWLPTRNSS
jgi:UDP-N-acetylmuramoyl-L-alanyl-D-glutamate--2,6-diaminopimelate ligase